MNEAIQKRIPTECPWRDTLYWYDTIDSTNTQAKILARQGAKAGTVLIAQTQTAGRGRLGRQFHSPAGLGLYLSVILRPQCKPEKLMHLTCATAVASCNAIEQVCGVRPGVKWINDLVLENKKLGGILTELSIDHKTGLVEFAVVGIGINCRHKKEHFPQELHPIATSLEMAGISAEIPAVAAALVDALFRMDAALLSKKQATMTQYRKDCITLGRDITVHRGDSVTPGNALDVDDEGALVVACQDGTICAVNSGEVSVRGLYNYI